MSAEGGFPSTLDLSGADTAGFSPIPADWYDVLVYEITHVEVEGADGKLPQGTPGINVQFKVDGGPYDNRRLFNRYWLPAEGSTTPEKRKTMLDMVANFFKEIGFTDEQIKSPSFNLVEACAEAVGKECKVNVKVDTQYDNNKITRVKARGGSGDSAQDGGLL